MTFTPCTNHSLIIEQLGAYGPCSIEGLVRYCLQQRTTTREAALEAIERIASRPEATVEDGVLMVEGLGGC
tara:strand:- start:462 stop:674 length:213 start_codon:yes stop_codon:yes gene_type:complete